MKTTPRFPRLRALVRALTSPRRVWFWTTTLPVLLAPVLLYLVMRPGVAFDRRVTVGAVKARFERFDDAEGQRTAGVRLGWPGGWGVVECKAPSAMAVEFWPYHASHRFGPLVWRWSAECKGLAIDSHSFSLSAQVRH